jgi:hypothetical protein
VADKQNVEKKKGEDCEESDENNSKKSEFEDLSPERAGKLPELFTESPYYEAVKKTLEAGVMPEKSAYKPPDLKSTHANTLTQIIWLTHRFFSNVHRNKFGLVIRYFLIFVFVFFVGTIFLRLGYNQEWTNERLGVIFLTLINVMFSTNAFLPEFISIVPYTSESTKRTCIT